MIGDFVISLPVCGFGATMMGELAISLPVCGFGATMMGDLAISLPVCGFGATMIGEEAKETAVPAARAEARITNFTFNEIEVIVCVSPVQLSTEMLPQKLQRFYSKSN